MQADVSLRRQRSLLQPETAHVKIEGAEPPHGNSLQISSVAFWLFVSSLCRQHTPSALSYPQAVDTYIVWLRRSLIAD